MVGRERRRGRGFGVEARMGAFRWREVRLLTRREKLPRGVECWAKIWYNMGHEDKEEVKYGHCSVGRAVDGD